MLARVGRAVLGLVLLLMSTAAVAPEEEPDFKFSSTYIPEQTHPTLHRFHMDDRMTRVVMGPFGSGKSVACVMEIIRRSCQQAAFNGVRYTRWAVVRNTYPELKTTSMKTWQDWIGTRVIMDVPYHTTVKINLPDGTRVESEVYFFALDRPEDVDKLMGIEFTGIWINEGRYISEAVYDTCIGRKGRYPGSKLGGCTWNGIWIDTNPPDKDHWLYRLCVTENDPNTTGFFRQPGGLIKTVSPGGKVAYIPNPEAENIENLPDRYKYYFDMLGRDEDYIKVHVLGEWGTVFTGRPVYEPWFIESVHISKDPLQPMRGLPIVLGFDGGLTPACIIGQVTPLGQVRLLREFTFRDGGMRQMCEREVIPVLNQDFAGMDRKSWHDPADGGAQGDSEITINSVLTSLGFNPMPRDTVTNNFPLRREAVIKALSRMIGGQPGLLIDPRCETLIRG